MNKSKITVSIVGIVYAAIAFLCMLKPSSEYSVSERRKLAQKPEISWEALVSGKYMEQAEEYTVDQFPMRDRMRSLKAIFSMGVMRKLDTNEIYQKDGYLCAMEYPLDETSVFHAAEVFRGIYDKHLKETDSKVYVSVIPDKNFFLANETHLSMDYESFSEMLYEQTEFAIPIDIADSLHITDYYKTDSHWKQEEITKVAAQIADAMGASLSGEYAVREADAPFYGVYYGQAALPVEPDRIKYCTNEILEQCVVYDYENNKEIELYDIEKTKGRDPYEMFLGGNISLVTIENPVAVSEKELLVFGDSFSRSLVPLLAEGYRKTTLVDIRYLPSAYVENYVTFAGQDVLFVYSTSVLNNSVTLK